MPERDRFEPGKWLSRFHKIAAEGSKLAVVTGALMLSELAYSPAAAEEQTAAPTEDPFSVPADAIQFKLSEPIAYATQKAQTVDYRCTLILQPDRLPAAGNSSAAEVFLYYQFEAVGGSFVYRQDNHDAVYHVSGGSTGNVLMLSVQQPEAVIDISYSVPAATAGGDRPEKPSEGFIENQVALLASRYDMDYAWAAGAGQTAGRVSALSVPVRIDTIDRSGITGTPTPEDTEDPWFMPSINAATCRELGMAFDEITQACIASTPDAQPTVDTPSVSPAEPAAVTAQLCAAQNLIFDESTQSCIAETPHPTPVADPGVSPVPRAEPTATPTIPSPNGYPEADIGQRPAAGKPIPSADSSRRPIIRNEMFLSASSSATYIEAGETPPAAAADSSEVFGTQRWALIDLTSVGIAIASAIAAKFVSRSREVDIGLGYYALYKRGGKSYFLLIDSLTVLVLSLFASREDVNGMMDFSSSQSLLIILLTGAVLVSTLLSKRWKEAGILPPDRRHTV